MRLSTDVVETQICSVAGSRRHHSPESQMESGVSAWGNYGPKSVLPTKVSLIEVGSCRVPYSTQTKNTVL